MRTIQLTDWPFPKGETVTVYWVTSPQPQSESGARCCYVYFQRESGGEPEPVRVPWGLMPELWIGRPFRDGIPLHQEPGELVTIRADEVTDLQLASAADSIPGGLYSLYKLRGLCRENCVSFRCRGKKYVIPCMELARVLYMQNSLLANRLISDGGLAECITLSSWRESGDSLEFDLASACRGYQSEKLVRLLAALYGVPALRSGWEDTYVQWKKGYPIRTTLPALAGLALKCRHLAGKYTTFLTSVVETTLPMPYRSIRYGPVEKRSVKGEGEGNGREAKGSREHRELRETILLGDAREAAKSGGDVASRSMGGTATSFSGPGVRMQRKTVKVPGGTGTREEGKTAGALPKEADPEDLFTPNERTGRGTFPAARIIPTKEQEIPEDADFPDFCAAIGKLSAYEAVTVERVTYGTVPGDKSVSFVSREERRRYAVARVSVCGQVWEIIELCRRDGYSLSTLLVKNPDRKKRARPADGGQARFRERPLGAGVLPPRYGVPNLGSLSGSHAKAVGGTVVP